MFFLSFSKLPLVPVNSLFAVVKLSCADSKALKSSLSFLSAFSTIDSCLSKSLFPITTFFSEVLIPSISLVKSGINALACCVSFSNHQLNLIQFF